MEDCFGNTMVYDASEEQRLSPRFFVHFNVFVIDMYRLNIGK